MSLLVRLLRSHEAHACGAAAGTIQNLSREERSRAVLTSLGAVEPLADLLVGRHVKSQVRIFQGMNVPLKVRQVGGGDWGKHASRGKRSALSSAYIAQKHTHTHTHTHVL